MARRYEAEGPCDELWEEPELLRRGEEGTAEVSVRNVCYVCTGQAVSTVAYMEFKKSDALNEQ